MKSLPHPAQRRIALEKVAAYIKSKGLPFKLIVIKVPHHTVLASAKELVWRAIDDTCLQRAERIWIKSKVQFVVSRTPVWKDKWTHGQHASQASLFQLVSVPRKLIMDSLSGCGFTRPLLNWKLEFRSSERDMVAMICKDIKKAFLTCGLACVACSINPMDLAVSLRCNKKYCAVKCCEQHSQPLYAAYTAPMEDMVKNGAVIPDDKLKQVAWGLPVVAYHVLCVIFLVLSPTWFLVPMSAKEANNLIVARLLSILGPKLARRFGVVPGAWLLPKGYVTIKSKCFAAGQKNWKSVHQS